MICGICADRAVAATVAAGGGRYKSDGEKIRIVSEKKFASAKQRIGVDRHSTETSYRAIAARAIERNAIAIKISSAFVLTRGRTEGL